jgi:pterin-4a-carbinolamine dehydratase
MRLWHVVCRDSNTAFAFQREKGNIAHGLQHSPTWWWKNVASVELLVSWQEKCQYFKANIQLT